MKRHFISNFAYPALQLFQTPDKGLWNMPMFKNIFEEKKVKDLSPEELARLSIENPGPEMDVVITKERLTPKRLSEWPLFAVDQKDFEALSTDQWNSIHSILSLLWAMNWHDCTPEVVLPELYDNAFYHKPDGYDQWLEKLVAEKRHLRGVWVRVQDEVVVMYDINYSQEQPMESSCTLWRNKLVSFHVNFNGYINSTVARNARTPEMERVMWQRGVDLQTAVFQEDMYNILVTEYYKQYYMLKPVPLKKGDTEGPYIITTDVPLVACVGFSKKS